MARLINGLTHPEVATKYAQDVVDGKILACKWVYRACQRHLADLVASKREDYPFKYDHKKAQRFCTFFEMLPHVEGQWAARGEKLLMEPWQCFIACSIFGWVTKNDGMRRFRRVYCCVPRKNAKSTFAAAVGDFCLILDGEYGAQVWSGATSKEQASFVFNPAKQMLVKSEAICKKYGIEVNADSIVIRSKNCFFKRLIGNPGDGGSPSCAIVDEYHEHPDARLFDTMSTGMGARQQPLLFVITTAGFDTAGPCYLLQKDMEKILDGIVKNDRTFAIIYTCDLEPYTREDGVEVTADDWTSVSALIKANPNWGISVNIEDTIQEQQEAIAATEKQNTFKTKKLNIWCFAKNGFFNVEKWHRCTDRSLSIEQFAGQPCVKGLDLASQIDLAADVTVFEKELENPVTCEVQTHYYVFSRFYVPESTVAKPTNQHYQKWVHEGDLEATPGDEIDLPRIRSNILADIAEYDVRELCYDKHQATLMKQDIIAASGIEGAEIPQNPPTLNQPMKMLQAMIASGRIHHNGNGVMSWCVSNVVSREDANENDFPRKERPESKIDGVTALLNALFRVKEVLGAANPDGFEYNGF